MISNEYPGFISGDGFSFRFLRRMCQLKVIMVRELNSSRSSADVEPPCYFLLLAYVGFLGLQSVIACT